MLASTLITGAGGQLGEALRKIFHDRPDVRFTSVDSPSGRDLRLDLTDPEQIKAIIEEVKPRWVINAAAYTAVERAEDEENLAFAINAIAPTVMAEVTHAIGATLIHFSTDYVFDGNLDRPYVESDRTAPINVYGRSKQRGEQGVTSRCERFFVIRTTWLFSSHGHNFLKTMLKLGSEKESLAVVADQWGAPTSARFLAEATAKIMLEDRREYGVYHLTCGGKTSWHGFAEEIFRCARDLHWPLKVQTVKKLSTEEYGSKLDRPKNSSLNSDKFLQTFDVSQPTWQDEVRQVVGELASPSSR